MSQCKYEHKDRWGSSYQCHEDVWSGGFCIYHSPDNGNDEATATLVWQEAHKRAQYPLGCHFIGWHFPEDPKKQWFRGIVFRHVLFMQATFQGEADFREATFQGDASFTKASFQGHANFLSVSFQGNADFREATFQGKADFNIATFQGDAYFTEATFQGDVFFSMAKFQSQIVFYKAIFKNKVFAGDLFPWGGTNVRIDLPSRELSFAEASPFRQREQGECLYRLAKECAQRQGNYSTAGEYHFAEQCAKEYGNRKKSAWKLWWWGFWKSRLEWVFARMIFGYGEKVLRPLITGLVVIFIWAVLYFAMGGVAPGGLEEEAARLHEPGFGECFYFSLVTFTTLGYGDMAPKAPLFFRLFAGGEALLGAGLMALFVVALARKYTR